MYKSNIHLLLEKNEGVKRYRARAPPVIQYCTRSGQE
jgi:hypothetical protein